MHIPTIHIDEQLVEITYREIPLPDRYLSSYEDSLRDPRLYLGSIEIPLRQIRAAWVGKVPQGTTAHDLDLR